MPKDLGQTLSVDPTPGAPQDSLRRPQRAGKRLGATPQGVSRSEPGANLGERSEPGRPPPPFPCPLKSDISNEPIPFPASAARTAWALQVNVQAFCERHGIERVGFFTLTFAELLVVVAEAQRRYNSLATGAIRPRYREAIRVLERQRSGSIHYHLLVALPFDIRTGFDFEAACPPKGVKADYRSASPALRAEWKFWRETAKRYGFGRTELLPIRSTSEAVGRYVGGYIGKHCEVRQERDRGARLVSYIGPRVATQRFGWATGGGRQWRAGLEALVRDLAAAGHIDGVSVEAMRRRYGRSWAWDWRDVIAYRAGFQRQVYTVDSETGEIKAGAVRTLERS